MYSLTFSFTSHIFFINLNINLFILCFLYVISSFIMKSTYITLLKLSVYVNSDFRHNVCEHCVYDVINLSNNCKHTVN